MRSVTVFLSLCLQHTHTNMFMLSISRMALLGLLFFLLHMANLRKPSHIHTRTYRHIDKHLPQYKCSFTGWKMVKICSQPHSVHTHAQAVRKILCASGRRTIKRGQTNPHTHTHALSTEHPLGQANTVGGSFREFPPKCRWTN